MATNASWKWLQKYKLSNKVSFVTNDQGTPLSGHEMFQEIESFWRTQWPADTQAERSNLLQQLHDTAPWPQNPRSPVLRPIRGIDLKNKAMNMTSKAVGPDQWSAQEIVHFPDQLLELYAEFFNKLETHGQWPKALLQWRQVLIPKPGKDTGIAKDLRPISIGSIWYRIYSSIRITQYSNWVERAGPEFHGGLRHRGTATALLGPLCAWQRTQNDDISPGVRRRIIARRRLIRYMGASDLSKAFDRLHGTLAGQALQRMGYPPDVVRAWQSAWHGQERFLQLGNQTSQNPVGEIFCLPQGDPASPMGLLAPLAEAMKRLQEAHPIHTHGQNIWRCFVDDRSWWCSKMSTCLSIAEGWRQEVARLNMDENRSKADFAVVGATQTRTRMNLEIQQRGLPGQVLSRPKVLGTRIESKRCFSKAEAEEKDRFHHAAGFAHAIVSLPGGCKQKAQWVKEPRNSTTWSSGASALKTKGLAYSN